MVHVELKNEWWSVNVIFGLRRFEQNVLSVGIIPAADVLHVGSEVDRHPRRPGACPAAAR